MAALNVVAYWAQWDLNDHFGRFWIKTDDNIVTISDITSAAEFSVVIDILRSEKPLTWDKTTKQLTTNIEPPGESEV